MILFALSGSREFGERVGVELGLPLAAHEERTFDDGEHKTRSLVSVRGQDAYVVQGLHADPTQSVNDKLCRLLFFLAALRDHGAARVTAVVPYLAYARKDRQTKPHDPVTTQYVARLFEASGVDCVVALEVHNVVAFQNAFRSRTIHLEADRVLAPHIRSLDLQGAVVVMSPDPGGVKRAQLFRERLEGLGVTAGQAFMDKRRSAGLVRGDLLVGDVSNAHVLIVDDLIASGETMARASRAAMQHGARDVRALAAHGLFTGDAAELLSSAALTRTIVTDSVPPFRLDPAFVKTHVEVVSAAPMIAAVIARLHAGGSITDALGG